MRGNDYLEEDNNDAYDEIKLSEEDNFQRREVELGGSFKKGDDKGKVFAAIMICALMFIAAMMMFFHAFYYNYGNKLDRGSNDTIAYNESEDDDQSTETEENGESAETEANDQSIDYESIKNESVEEESVKDKNLTADQLEIKYTAEHFLEAVKNMNFDECYKYTQNNECSMDFINEQIKKEDTSIVQYNTFFKKMMDYDYIISEVKNEGDKAKVKAVIKTYNFTLAVMDARLHVSDAQIAYSFKNKNMSESKKKEIAQEELAKILNQLERSIRVPVEIELVKTDDGWKITSDSIDNEIKPAIMQNLYDSIEAYCDFYKALNNNEIKNGEISIDSFKKYLETNGINYNENSDKSPFN